MASIERTAYPRFKENLTPTELEQLYQPSLDESTLCVAMPEVTDNS